MGLTVKQDNFCNYIAMGKDQRESYMLAYDCQSKSAASIESTKLLKRDDITERIKELRKPIINLEQNKAISERQQRIDFILERIRICEEKEDEQSLIRWNDQLCKLYGLFKETEQQPEKENEVNNLDMSLLKRLSAV